MMIDAAGVGPDYTCTTRWRIELWVKTTAKDEVSGTAEGQHAPQLSCTFVGGPDQGGVTSFAVSGSFDGRAFRLHLKGTGDSWFTGSPAWPFWSIASKRRSC